MWSIVFFAFTLIFSALLWDAYATGRVMARGWGTSIRYYSRTDEPVGFWIHIVTYTLIVALAIFVAVMMLGR